MLSAAFLAESVRSSLSFFPVTRSTEMPVVAKKRFGNRALGGAKKLFPLELESGDAQPLRLAFANGKLDHQVTFISIVVPEISPSPCAK